MGNPKRSSKFLCLNCMKINELGSGIQRGGQPHYRAGGAVRDFLSAIPARRKMRAGHSLGGCTPHRRRCDSGHDPFPPGLRAGLLLLAAGWGIALPAQMEKTCASPAILLHFCSRKPGRQKNRPGFDFLKMKFLIRAYASAGSSPAGRRLRPARPATGPSAIHPRFSGVYKAL